MQRRDKFIHRQHCAGRIFARFRVATKRRVPRFRVATTGYIPPEPGLHQKDFYQIQDCNKGMISQVHHRSKITRSSRVRIASERILGQMQESSKGFVSQSRNCNKSFIPPESGLQHECLFLQSQDCNIRIFGQIQESSTGFVFQLASWLAG